MKSNVKLPKNLTEWAYTYYEIVCILERLSQEDYHKYDYLRKVLDDGLRVADIYDLAIELTNEFHSITPKHGWGSRWHEAILEFVELKIK